MAVTVQSCRAIHPIFIVGVLVAISNVSEVQGKESPDVDARRSASCARPSAVEWRLPASSHLARNTPQDRAAVCFLGVARFVDSTAAFLRENLLNRLGVAFDLYTFASQGRHERTCEEYQVKDESWSAEQHLGPLVLSWADDAPAPKAEWRALIPLYDLAVAGRIVWDDRPMDLLQGSNVWRRAATRPGAWLGGLAHPGDSKVRPGAGLAQLRALQWCADSIRWHEEHVLHAEYTHVVFSRWDLQWLIPFPGLPLLTSIDPKAVWVFATIGDYFANDRFAALPREFLSAYFEGWKLLISGEADDAIQAVLPSSGLPVYHADHTNCEAFLYARLRYAGAHLGGLPGMAYVYCTPTNDLSTLRSLGYHSCTPISEMFGSFGVAHALQIGGSKYAREFQSALMTDNVLEGIFDDSMETSGAQGEYDLWGGRFQRLYQQQRPSFEWTPDLVERAAFVGSQFEINKAIEEGVCADADSVQIDFHRCDMMMRRLVSLAASRAEYLRDALVVARAMVFAAPLHLENWIWLAFVLVHPYFDNPSVAAAAVREAYRLNSSHAAVRSLQGYLPSGVWETSGGLRSKALAEALGDASNVTRRLAEVRAQTLRQLRTRRALQRSCAQARHPRNQDELSAWIAFGEYLLRDGWVFAVAGVLAHLETEFLRDERPEALRESAWAVRLVGDLSWRLNATVLEPAGWVVWGSGLEDYRRRAPTLAELLSEEWLERYEALTCFGGRDLAAADVKNVIFAWSSSWKQMIPVALT